MNSYQAMVRQFHHKFGSTIGRYPAMRDRQLAAKLIMEEAVETCAALGFEVTATMDLREAGDPTNQTSKDTLAPVVTFHKNFDEPNFEEFIDGLCDTLYVTFGAAVRAGIDLDPFFHEVHAANMRKEGGALRADRKVLKPEGWRGPDIAGVLARQNAWGPDPSVAEVRDERLLHDEPA